MSDFKVGVIGLSVLILLAFIVGVTASYLIVS